MPSPGRPRALDENKQREVIALVSAGCGIGTAARYVGCSDRTILREIRRNKEFWDRFRKAELAASLSPLQTIKEAANHNWRAATWLLERKLPREFAPAHRDMFDPHVVYELFERFFNEIRRSIPDEKMRRCIVRRIRRTMTIAVHESVTKRKSPNPRPLPSPLRKPGERLPGDPPPKRRHTLSSDYPDPNYTDPNYSDSNYFDPNYPDPK